MTGDDQKTQHPGQERGGHVDGGEERRRAVDGGEVQDHAEAGGGELGAGERRPSPTTAISHASSGLPSIDGPKVRMPM